MDYMNDNMIKQLPFVENDSTHCPFCKNSSILKDTCIYIYDFLHEYYKLVQVYALYCRKCDLFFLNDNIQRLIKRNNYFKYAPYFFLVEDEQSLETIKAKTKKGIYSSEIMKTWNKNDINKDIYSQIVDGPTNCLIVNKFYCNCLTCERHGFRPTMQSCTLIIPDEYYGEMRINVERCNHCGRFYINNESLSYYEKLYNKTFIERYYIDGLPQERTNGYKDNTILSLCGYRAQQGDDDFHRQAVIKFILNNGIAGKSEILNILGNFIEHRSESCPYAILKWKVDYEFTNDYKIMEQKRVYDLKFILNKDIKK